jgi:CPA2 family monovalent cation:H+ antiporter-2
MHDAQLFLQDLALVLSVAAVVTVVFRLIRQPPVLGYLLAGIIIGPHVPIPLFADLDRIQTLSELGVILVMFSIGLEFSVRRVVQLLPTSGVTGLIQLSGMIWLGYSAGQIFGWPARESLFAGCMVAISSTMIVARTFDEEKVDEKVAGIVFGILIVQDLAAVLLLAILTAVASGQGASAAEVANTAGQLGAFLLATVVLGFLLVPRAVRLVVRLGSSETLLVATVGLCFAMALLAHELGYSVALGAFLAGSLIAESGEGERVHELVAPLRDLFAAVFFVAVGMIVDPLVVLDSWPAVLALALLVLIAQPALVSFGTFAAGNDVRSSVRAGMSLAQIGEFSFIIAGIGVASGAVREFLYPVAVAVCVITSFLTPWMVRVSTPIALLVERRLPHRVQTYTSLYASWREALRERRHAASTAARIRRLVTFIAVDGVALAALFISAVMVHRRDLVQSVGIPDEIAVVLVIAGAILLAVPFAVGLMRSVRRLGQTLAGLVLPAVEPGRLDMAAAPRRAFVVTLQVVMALLVGLPLMLVTQPFLPWPVGVAVLAAVLALLGISFWRSAANLDEHVKAGAQLVAEALIGQAAPPARLHSVESVLPGLGHLSSVRLAPGSPAIGRSLVELDLRGRTGASVIMIGRAGGAITPPTGREPLAEGDVLALTGSGDAIEAASVLLADAQVPGQDPSTQSISRSAGK